DARTASARPERHARDGEAVSGNGSSPEALRLAEEIAPDRARLRSSMPLRDAAPRSRAAGDAPVTGGRSERVSRSRSTDDAAREGAARADDASAAVVGDDALVSPVTSTAGTARTAETSSRSGLGRLASAGGALATTATSGEA